MRKLSEVIEINPDSIKQDYKHKIIEYIDISSVGTGELHGTSRYIIKEAPSRAKRLVRHGDIIIATVRPNRRSFLYVKNPPDNLVVSTGFAVLRAKPEVDSRFLYFTINDQLFTDYLANNAKGAAYPAVDTEIIGNAKIRVPNLKIQREIAAILSAYDDLIENNTRRIQILEEMAQRIYREWFVHFRFPGHENVKMMASELGMIPEGWEAKKFSDVVEINPIIKINKNEEYPFVLMADVSANSLIVECNNTRFGASGSKFQNFDVIFPRITPSVEHGKGGFVLFLQNDQIAAGSTEFIVFRSKDLCPEMVYFISKEPEFRENAVKSMIGASGRQRVQNECFDNFLVAKPDQAIIQKYSQIGKTIIKEIYLLFQKNKLLRQTRDLLLPKLISGKIDVSDLEIEIGGMEDESH